MRKRIAYLLMGMLSLAGNEAAAQKIDFNQQANAGQTPDGYTMWEPFTLASGATKSLTVDGVTITVGHGQGTQATQIKSNWYKNGCSGGQATNESKLVCDGIYGMMANNELGDYGKTTEMVAISVKIKGLSAGNHSVQAYHNYLDGGTVTLPTIGVKVNGTTKVTGISQTQRMMTMAKSAKSVVEFTVGSTTDEVELTYFSEPKSGTEYTTTYFYINALEVDPAAPAEKQAQNPYPANGDRHVAGESGVTFKWEAAAGATAHVFYLGTNEDEVKSATNGETLTTTSTTKSGLSPLERYYWRVDEVIDGTTYKGNVWSMQPRRLAFPGADGAGKYAIGGRGGTVYHVTNLNDDNSEGSLRYGLENLSGPRTIVFDVSGEILLHDRLTFAGEHITIAGQTAPGIGILVRDEPFGAGGNDCQTRFLRFRYGHGDDWSGGAPNQNTGNAAGLSGDHSIMDHCLLGWGSDETFSSRGAKNISFQRCIIGESLNQNGHKNYWNDNPGVLHGYAATVAGEVASLHHNLLAHNEGRNWSLGGGLDGANNFAGRLNIYNNVCYNWGGRATDGGAHQVNFVGNYYKMGPSTSKKVIFEATHEDNFAGTQEYYLSENIRENLDGTKTGDTMNDTYKSVIKNGVTVNWQDFVSTPYDFWALDMLVESADGALKNVLSDVGCNFERLDNNEQRLVKETRDGTWSKTGSRSGKKGLVDKESDSEGWNGLGMVQASRPEGWDTDRDGIADWYETARGWSTSSANNNDCTSSDYYTNLEEYLNWMAKPHFIGIKAGAEQQVQLADLFAGYKNPSYNVISTSGVTATISGGTLKVTPQNSMDKQLFTLTVTAQEDGIALARDLNFYVGNVETNGIVAPKASEGGLSEAQKGIFTLSGQRVSSPTLRGVYIKNGKKIIK